MVADPRLRLTRVAAPQVTSITDRQGRAYDVSKESHPHDSGYYLDHFWMAYVPLSYDVPAGTELMIKGSGEFDVEIADERVDIRDPEEFPGKKFRVAHREFELAKFREDNELDD